MRLTRTVHFNSEASASNPSSACAGWLMRWMASKFCNASTLGSGCFCARNATLCAKRGALTVNFVLVKCEPGGGDHDGGHGSARQQRVPVPTPAARPRRLQFLALDGLHHARGEIG